MDDTVVAIVEHFGTHLKMKSVDSTINFSSRKMKTEEMLLQLQNFHK